MEGWFQLQHQDKSYDKDNVRHLFNGNQRLCFKFTKAIPSKEQNADAFKCGACLQIIKAKRSSFVDPDAEQTAKDILGPKRPSKRPSKRHGRPRRVVPEDPTPPVPQPAPSKPVPPPVSVPRTPRARPAPPPPPHDPKRIPTVEERYEAIRLQKLARTTAIEGKGKGHAD